MPKIHVTWPPGCYGSYIMQSVYVYSNLNTYTNIIIDSTGSSHTFRDSKEKKKYFTFDHCLSNDSDIIISSVAGHELDYFASQLIKQKKSDVLGYLEVLFPNFKHKIDKYWNNSDVWNLREWISFWIVDALNTYKYNPNAHIATNQLFDEDKNVFPKVITSLIEKVGLTTVSDIDFIKDNHKRWIEAQQYHNLQNRCDNWVREILQTQKNTPSPCITILCEAYVQHCLRSHGYEIRCFKLNNFPKTSNELRLLLDKESGEVLDSVS